MADDADNSTGRDNTPLFVISGGSPGTDRGALRAARDTGHITAGIVPKGHRLEETVDGDAFASTFGLQEHDSSSSFKVRDKANVDLLLQGAAPSNPPLVVCFLQVTQHNMGPLPMTGRGAMQTAAYAATGEYDMDIFVQKWQDIFNHSLVNVLQDKGQSVCSIVTSALTASWRIQLGKGTRLRCIVLCVPVIDGHIDQPALVATNIQAAIHKTNKRIFVTGPNESTIPGIEYQVDCLFRHIFKGVAIS